MLDMVVAGHVPARTSPDQDISYLSTKIVSTVRCKQGKEGVVLTVEGDEASLENLTFTGADFLTAPSGLVLTFGDGSRLVQVSVGLSKEIINQLWRSARQGFVYLSRSRPRTGDDFTTFLIPYNKGPALTQFLEGMRAFRCEPTRDLTLFN